MVYSRNNSMRQLFTFSTTEAPTTSLLPPYQLPSDVLTSGLYTACSLPSASSDHPSTTLFELEMSGKLISSVYGANEAGVSTDKTVFWDENVFELNRAAKVETTVTSKRYSARAVYEGAFALWMKKHKQANMFLSQSSSHLSTEVLLLSLRWTSTARPRSSQTTRGSS